MEAEKKGPGRPPKDKTQEQIEASRERRARRRADIGVSNMRLEAPPRAGFVRRFVNDVPGRIDRFRENGWETAEKDGGTDSRFVGKLGRAQESGSLYGNAVLMEIPEEFYREDQAAKAERIVDPMQMKENRAKAGASADTPDEYIPGGRESALQKDKLR